MCFSYLDDLIENGAPSDIAKRVSIRRHCGHYECSQGTFQSKPELKFTKCGKPVGNPWVKKQVFFLKKKTLQIGVWVGF